MRLNILKINNKKKGKKLVNNTQKATKKLLQNNIRHQLLKKKNKMVGFLSFLYKMNVCKINTMFNLEGKIKED